MNKYWKRKWVEQTAYDYSYIFTSFITDK